jgi:subtilisin family serine protease
MRLPAGTSLTIGKRTGTDLAEDLGAGGAAEYHANMLLVRVNPSSETRAMLASAAGPAGRRVGSAVTLRPDTPGMALLATLERAGRIRRATPLSPASPSRTLPSAGRAFAALAASLDSAGPDDGLAGVTLLELEGERSVVEDLRDRLAADPNVEAVSPVPVRYLAARRPLATRRSIAPAGGPAAMVPAAAAPPPATMWNLSRIRWDEARGVFNFDDAAGVKVAVLDTGVDRDHPDLLGRVAGYTYQYPNVSGESGEGDIVGHGTHVAGTIGASANNGFGINGICPCELHCWKIFNDEPVFLSAQEGWGYVVDPARYIIALQQCFAQQMDVVNLSIGGRGRPSFAEDDAFNALLSRETVVVAAMGNGRQRGSLTEYPAAITGVLAIGATNVDDTIANFSNRGAHAFLSAPGVGVWSTLPTYGGQGRFLAVPAAGGDWARGAAVARETDYDAWRGTSMAAPHVAAAVALLRARHPGITRADVRRRLIESADRPAGMGHEPRSPDFGFGRLNLLRLLA